MIKRKKEDEQSHCKGEEISEWVQVFQLCGIQFQRREETKVLIEFGYSGTEITHHLNDDSCRNRGATWKLAQPAEKGRSLLKDGNSRYKFNAVCDLCLSISLADRFASNRDSCLAVCRLQPADREIIIVRESFLECVYRLNREFLLLPSDEV